LKEEKQKNNFLDDKEKKIFFFFFLVFRFCSRLFMWARFKSYRPQTRSARRGTGSFWKLIVGGDTKELMQWVIDASRRVTRRLQLKERQRGQSQPENHKPRNNAQAVSLC
jgi:hypothetical protein